MTVFQRLIGSLLLSIVLLAHTTSAMASCFPSARLQPLQSGPSLNLPKANTPLFIAIGFEPHVQPQLEQSLLVAKQLQQAGVTVRLVEIPVIEAQYQAFASQINPFMRNQVKNKALLEFVYPMYTNKALIRQQLGLSTKQEQAFLVCSRTGKLLWKSTQPLTNASLNQLKVALKQGQ